MSVLGSTNVTPRLGTIVRYSLSESDVVNIVKKRREAGIATRSGNEPREGDTYPALIVRDWGADAETRVKYAAGQVTRADEARTVVSLAEAIDYWSVNLQVFLDGNDTYWVTSASKFDPTKHGRFNLPENSAGPNDTGAVQADYSQFWESDPRGHWTDEPVVW